MLAQVQIVDEITTTYASAADYCKIFDEEMDSLYLLAFLLTADSDKAEQCFIDGLGECVDRIGVLMSRAQSSARRAIVKEAIRMFGPAPEEGADGFFINARWATTVCASDPFAVIVSLGAFERFVFVMSVLEGQSVDDCQSLLKCSRQEVLMAREVALRLLTAATAGCGFVQEEPYTLPQLLN